MSLRNKAIEELIREFVFNKNQIFYVVTPEGNVSVLPQLKESIEITFEELSSSCFCRNDIIDLFNKKIDYGFFADEVVHNKIHWIDEKKALEKITLGVSTIVIFKKEYWKKDYGKTLVGCVYIDGSRHLLIRTESLGEHIITLVQLFSSNEEYYHLYKGDIYNNDESLFIKQIVYKQNISNVVVISGLALMYEIISTLKR